MVYFLTNWPISKQNALGCSRHSLTASMTTWLRARTRQLMTNGLVLLAR